MPNNIAQYNLFLPVLGKNINIYTPYKKRVKKEKDFKQYLQNGRFFISYLGS